MEANPPLVDTHAHLADPLFDPDREAVLQRAAEAGVRRIVLVGETLDDARRNLDLAARWPDRLAPAAGLYPTHLDEEAARQMEAFVREHQDVLAAIGEVGLDYWAVQDPAQQELQRKIFARFIALSNELTLPLNVHSRSAGRHAITFLKEHGARYVQMHAFDGRAGAALEGVAQGYLFSVPPSIVRSRQKQKLVARLPVESLLLETDSPVLGPEPRTRNEPANLPVALRAVAEIKGLPAADLARQILDNTRRLYTRLGV